MILWILEHSGGSYDDQFKEIVGVFDTAEQAMRQFPKLQWKQTKLPKYQTWEAEHSGYPCYLFLYPMELNKLYPFDYNW